jgi:hypothetical protein
LDKIIIETSTAVCGAGKTHWAKMMMASTPGQYLLVQPRQDLIDKTAAELRRLNVMLDVRVVHGAVNVNGLLVFRHARTLPYTGNLAAHCVVLITHETLRQADLSGYERWMLIVDELPPVWIYGAYTVPATNTWFDRNFRTETTERKGWYRVIARKAGVDLARIMADDFARDAATFAKSVLRRKHSVFVNVATFEDVDEFEWYAIFEPEALRHFAKIYLLGNAIEQSLLHKLWSTEYADAVEFVPFDIEARAYQARHVTIEYFSERDAAVTYFDDKDYHPLEDICLWLDQNASADHIYAFNNGRGRDLVQGTRIAPKASGSNQYRHIHEASILYASRPSNKEKAVFKLLGLTEEEVRTAREYEDLFQFLCRTSIRDPSSSHPVTWRVFSRNQADYLARAIANDKVSVSVVHHDVKLLGQTFEKRGPKEKATKMSGAERQRRYLTNKKAKAAAHERSPADEQNDRAWILLQAKETRSRTSSEDHRSAN